MDPLTDVVRLIAELCAYAAGASNGMDPGPLAAGAAAAGAAAAGGAAGPSRDRGARYTSDDGRVYDRPGGDTVVGGLPAGSRLIYDQVARDANGDPTDYHVRPGTGTPGWVPAGNTTDTRRAPPPPPHIILPPDSRYEGRAAQAHAGRG